MVSTLDLLRPEPFRSELVRTVETEHTSLRVSLGRSRQRVEKIMLVYDDGSPIPSRTIATTSTPRLRTTSSCGSGSKTASFPVPMIGCADTSLATPPLHYQTCALKPITPPHSSTPRSTGSTPASQQSSSTRARGFYPEPPSQPGRRPPIQRTLHSNLPTRRRGRRRRQRRNLRPVQRHSGVTAAARQHRTPSTGSGHATPSTCGTDSPCTARNSMRPIRKR